MISKESDLYPVVEQWLIDEKRCFKTAINKGVKYTRIDVIGIKDVGLNLSGKAEIIAIEVKRGEGRFANSCGQAVSNRLYANRVYLADLREDGFDEMEIQMASELGIGLISIKDGLCSEVLSSPYYTPHEGLSLAFLEQIEMFKCQICGTLFEDDGNTIELKEYVENKSLGSSPGLFYFIDALIKRKQKYGVFSLDGSDDSRSICKDCIEREEMAFSVAIARMKENEST